MFYVGNFILFYETSTFINSDLLWDNSIVPKKYILRMTYFTPDTFPPKFEKHFFPQNRFCILFFKVVHSLLQLVYGLLHPLLFVLLL